MRPPLRTLLRAPLAAALAAASCAPSPTPRALPPPPPSAAAPSPAPPAGAPAASSAPMRFATPTLAPPAFTDPARRDKLLAAIPDVDRYLAAEAEKLGFPGLAAGVVIDGELVYSKGFGFRDVEGKAPVDADTVFRIASMTKSFTAMAILMLRDEGKLSLEDPVARHVPELAALPYPTRDAAPITVRQLLSHGAGFPEDNAWGDRQLAMGEDELSAFLRRGISFSAAPNTQFEYSNLGFALLGRVVGRVSGVPYRDFMRARVLGPLGMKATVFDERQVPAGRLARGYRRERGALVPEVNLPDGAFGAMGGLFSSVRDMARYAAFHMAAWPARDDPETGPLRRSSAREMQQAARHAGLSVAQGTAERPPGATASGYGFGFGTSETCEYDRGVAHGGGLPGYGSTIQLLPEHGVAFIALANVTYAQAGRLAQPVFRLLAAKGGLARRAVTPAPALAEAQAAVGRQLARWDPAAARAAFAASFFQDVPEAQLASQLDALRSAHGGCRSNGAIDAENALRGAWKLACDRGWIDAWLTLTPAVPAQIQVLQLRGSFPPDEKLSRAADRLAALVGAWRDAEAAALFHAKVDRAQTKKLFADTGAARGACKVDAPVGGDGKLQARVRLACARHPIVVDFSIDAQSGKVDAAKLVPIDWRTGKCAQ